MKKTLYVLGGLAVAALLLAASVQAAPVLISDADLDGITGKSMEVDGTLLTALLDAGNSNSQNANYTWSDDHSGDQSDHKGANDISGSPTNVQETVISTSNVIVWGAASNGHAIVGTVGGTVGLDQSGRSSATQDIGGF